MAKIEKELQSVILAMSSKEKDKLLLRLIAKDRVLLERLRFELLEESSTIEERREEIRKAIDHLYQTPVYSSGYLMMDIRSVNALITHHVKITKDKYGEVELTLRLLNDCFEKQLKWIERYSSKTDKLASYVAKRTDFVLNKLTKLHPDIQFEFEEIMNTLLQRVHEFAPSYYARDLQIRKKFEIEYIE